jgi:hypothetical protein
LERWADFCYIGPDLFGFHLDKNGHLQPSKQALADLRSLLGMKVVR